MHKKQWLGAVALATIAALAAAGCGSSSNTDTAHIRSVDVAVNAGNASVTVNGGAVNGNQTFGQMTGYDFVGQGLSTFGFRTDATLLANILLPISTTLTLNTGSYYTTYLVGRSDVAGRASSSFLQAVVTGDRGAAAEFSSPALYVAPPSGQAYIRILNAAPDAGPVDVLIDGKPAFPAAAYPALPKPISGTTPAANPVTAYEAFSSSSLTVQINAAGTATVLVPATSVSVSSGNAYTLVVTEPTIKPTYGVQIISDQP